MGKKALNSIAFKELEKNPSLDYFVFAGAKNRNVSSINVTYSIILEKIVKKGNPNSKKDCKATTRLVCCKYLTDG